MKTMNTGDILNSTNHGWVSEHPIIAILISLLAIPFSFIQMDTTIQFLDIILKLIQIVALGVAATLSGMTIWFKYLHPKTKKDKNHNTNNPT